MRELEPFEKFICDAIKDMSNKIDREMTHGAIPIQQPESDKPCDCVTCTARRELEKRMWADIGIEFNGTM
jgi:hypothetical protein